MHEVRLNFFWGREVPDGVDGAGERGRVEEGGQGKLVLYLQCKGRTLDMIYLEGQFPLLLLCYDLSLFSERVTGDVYTPHMAFFLLKLLSIILSSPSFI